MAERTERITVDKYKYIKTSGDLVIWANEIIDIGWFTIDTEFIGENKFIPQLCLIQVHSENGLVLIDPISVVNLDPLYNVISDENILKIAHSGINDFRIFFQISGCVPKNVFDTQIAAGFVHPVYPLSLYDLVRLETGTRLKKGMAVSDWSKRPLSENQLAYALNDVIYLYDVYKSLMKKIKASGRYKWAQAAIDESFSKEELHIDFFSELSQSRAFNLASNRLAVYLYRIYKWREDKAREKNTTKQKIVNRKLIPDIAKIGSRNVNALKTDRRFKNTSLAKYFSDIISIFNTEPTSDELELVSSLKSKIRSTSNNLQRKDDLSDILFTLIKYLVNDSISIQLLLKKKDLQSIIREQSPMEEVLRPWQIDALGPQICSFLKNPSKIEIKIDESNCIKIVSPDCQ